MLLKRKGIQKLSLVLVLSLGTILSGCGANSTGNTPTPSSKPTEKLASVQEFNSVVQELPESFDPQQIVSSSGFTILDQVMEGLTRYEKNTTIVPGMASSWKVSEDGKTYTFTIRDAKWSDGKNVTAQDFEYAWKRMLNPKEMYSYSYLFYLISGAQAYQEGTGKIENVGIKSTDEHTLVVTLKQSAPYFLDLTTFTPFYPAREDFVVAQGEKYGTGKDQLLYNGPFVISQLSPEKLVLEKNKNYWDEKEVVLTGANISVLRDATSRIEGYESGKFDQVGLSSDFISAYENDSELNEMTTLGTSYFSLNLENKVLSNLNIRKALSAAINREELAKGLGVNKIAEGIVPDSINGISKSFREEVGNLLENNDPEKAKEYLKKGLEELGLDKLPVLTIVSDNEETSVQTTEKVIKNWAAIGVEAKPQVTANFDEWMDIYYKGEYEVLMNGWNGDYNDPMTFLYMYKTGSTENTFHYSNKDYDSLLDKADASTTPKDRSTFLQQAEKELFTDLPVIPTTQGSYYYISKSKVKNVYAHPSGSTYSLKWGYITEE